MENIFIYATIVFFTVILTAIATFNYVIVNQEIEKTPSGYTVTIFNNVYDYE